MRTLNLGGLQRGLDESRILLGRWFEERSMREGDVDMWVSVRWLLYWQVFTRIVFKVKFILMFNLLDRTLHGLVRDCSGFDEAVVVRSVVARF